MIGLGSDINKAIWLPCGQRDVSWARSMNKKNLLRIEREAKKAAKSFITTGRDFGISEFLLGHMEASYFRGYRDALRNRVNVGKGVK